MIPYFRVCLLGICWAAAVTAGAENIDLLQRYPTTLTAGDTSRGRPWTFSEDDIFALSSFQVKMGSQLDIELGTADVGIGHCGDGAVWAAVVPRTASKIVSTAAPNAEPVAHIWLRFHPRDLSVWFPPATVTGAGDSGKALVMLRVANAKFGNSWHMGRDAMIPPPGFLTVDLDTQNGYRRFFSVDRGAGTVEYVKAFENRPLPSELTLKPGDAEIQFDTVWQAYDREYPMFILRPEVDWKRTREEFRPRAAQCKTAQELAAVFAEMLRPLRDLHIWISVGNENVPVYSRPRELNANPAAWRTIFAEVPRMGNRVEWAQTTEGIGFMAIHSWDDPRIPDQVDAVLDNLKETRALIVDVRTNGGGDEPMAGKVAGRFLEKPVVYSYSRYRNGPKHEDLTEKLPREVQPRGPWRYERPVILLIGPRCMSSNESFIAMMAEAPNVTTWGERTCGSSGNPREIELPIHMKISLPRWIDILSNGQPLEEEGIQPDVPYKPEPDSFTGERDGLLTAALEHLRKTVTAKP
ncbi:MAG: S41 family peptidase [bacterium]